MSRRIGILGGTFDPPHIGHLLVAAQAYDCLDLDELLLIPASVPPIKGPVATPGSVRYEMVQAAVAGDPRFRVDSLELDREGVSYTIDTLRALHAQDPDAEWTFLLGIDQFRALENWKEPEEVCRIATLGVMARGGETPDLQGPYDAVSVPVSRIDVSSSAIRARAAAGESVRFYVPESVRAIIIREGLYRAVEEGAENRPSF